MQRPEHKKLRSLNESGHQMICAIGLAICALLIWNGPSIAEDVETRDVPGSHVRERIERHGVTHVEVCHAEKDEVLRIDEIQILGLEIAERTYDQERGRGLLIYHGTVMIHQPALWEVTKPIYIPSGWNIAIDDDNDGIYRAAVLGKRIKVKDMAPEKAIVVHLERHGAEQKKLYTVPDGFDFVVDGLNGNEISIQDGMQDYIQSKKLTDSMIVPEGWVMVCTGTHPSILGDNGKLPKRRGDGIFWSFAFGRLVPRKEAE